MENKSFHCTLILTPRGVLVVDDPAIKMAPASVKHNWQRPQQMKKEMQTFYNMRPSPPSDWNYNWHFTSSSSRCLVKKAEFQSTLVQNIECILSEKCQLVQSINEAEWCVCLSDKVGQPCVCVCYRRCGGEFYPQRIQCQWPITRIITEFLPSVLREKRVIWENVIEVIASSVWACKLYEGWACLSVLVKVKLELHVSYHICIVHLLTQKKYKTLLFLQLPPFPDYFSFAPIPRPKEVEVLFPGAYACEGSHISLRIWSVFSQGTWCVFSPLGTWRKKRRTYYRAATCEQGFRITLWNGETTWWCTKMHFTFYFEKVEHMNSFQHIGFLCIV